MIWLEGEKKQELVATLGMSEQVLGSQCNAKSSFGVSFLSWGDREHLACLWLVRRCSHLKSQVQMAFEAGMDCSSPEEVAFTGHALGIVES